MVYLGTVVVTALTSGLLLDLMAQGAGSRVVDMAHHGMPAFAGTASAVALLGVLGYALLAPLLEKSMKCCGAEGRNER